MDEGSQKKGSDGYTVLGNSVLICGTRFEVVKKTDAAMGYRFLRLAADHLLFLNVRGHLEEHRAVTIDSGGLLRGTNVTLLKFVGRRRYIP